MLLESKNSNVLGKVITSGPGVPLLMLLLPIHNVFRFGVTVEKSGTEVICVPTI